MIYSLISGTWLTVDRLRVYPRLFLWLYCVAIVFLVMTSNGNVDMLVQLFANRYQTPL